MKKILLLLIFVTSCATQKPVVITQVLLPQNKLTLIDHKFFKIAYDSERRLARYVVYEITAEHLKARAGARKDKFIADPILKEKNIPYVLPSEYVRTGYDRGHLAPSGDFVWNQEANDMTFVMSNMAPQSPNLNRDSWRRLEDQVRKWACGEKKIMVITGPILNNHLAKLPSGLEIPQDFFKIVIDETPPMKAISFVYHQTDKGDVLKERVVPMNTLENSTGIAFNNEFPEMKNVNERMPASLNEWKEEDCVN